MKYSGLMLTSLALCSTASFAASQATFSDNTLHIYHVEYMGSMYDVKMSFQPPNILTLQSADPISTMPDNPVVEVDEDLTFTITDIDVSGQNYRADFSFEANAFIVEDVEPAAHGKMFKGEQITNLGILAEGSFSYAYGVSDDGNTISGRSRDADRITLPIRYHYDHGHIEALGGLGGERAEGRAANNNGTIAGFATIPTDDDSRIYHAFYNKSGSETQDIGTLGAGQESRAYAINNHGTLVGWSASLADNTDHIAFSYDTTGGGTLKPLDGAILGGARSFAFDINDAGQITGVATTADGSALAFIYKDGVAINLGSLDNSGYSEARAINDKGQATGWSLDSEGNYTAFISDGSSMQRLPGLGGDTKAYDINTHGHVVGDARDAEDDRHAFLYKDGKLHDLYEMLPAADKENWKELREAYSISDNGIVVGRGRFWTDKENEKDSSRAFRIQL